MHQLCDGFLRTGSIDCAQVLRRCRIRFRRVIASPAIAMRSPSAGRVFASPSLEEVIRENLDLGGSQVSLVFDRKVIRPHRAFRTRVITGRRPCLAARRLQKIPHQAIPQEGQALRTETTINDTRRFAIGRRIENLQELRKIGFAATDVCSTSNHRP